MYATYTAWFTPRRLVPSPRKKKKVKIDARLVAESPVRWRFKNVREKKVIYRIDYRVNLDPPRGVDSPGRPTATARVTRTFGPEL